LSEAAAVYSMTGFASVRLDGLEVGSATLSLKSVNHRFLDLQVRIPGQMEALEAQLRKLLTAALRRGHVELSLQIERRVRASVGFNEELLAGYIDAFRAAAEKHGLNAEPDLNEMLRLPGMLTAQAAPGTQREEVAGLEAAVLEAVPGLLELFQQAREQEGASLVAALRASMERLRVLADEAAALREGVREAMFERLRGRIAELTQPTASGELEARMLTEAALLAERSDVEEELVRLRTHAERFLAMLEAGGEVGKRLDFLLQELNREANTLLSKTSGASSGNGLRITEIGLEMKVEIERAREQVQNLE